MTCRSLRPKLSSYLDGGLEPAEARGVGAHLEGCGPCRAHLDSLRGALDALAELPRVAPPESIAQRVRERLEQELGVKTVLTREDDRLLSLTQRTEIANQMDGDLFISIHCNSWFSEETGGFEAYFLSPAKTDYDRAVAAAENAADEFANVKSDAGNDIQFILWDVVQNEFINESSHFAELVQKAMSDRLEVRNRGVKQAGFTVLQGARMPAVLIETAFLSNPGEEKLLLTESFREQVTDGILEAVRRFRERFEQR